MVSVIVSRFSSSHFFRCLKPPQIWPVTEYHAYSPNDTVNRVFSHHPVAADISMFFTVLFALSLAGFWKKVDDYCSVLYHPVIRKSLQWYIVILYKTQNFWVYRVLRFSSFYLFFNVFYCLPVWETALTVELKQFLSLIWQLLFLEKWALR